jgi:hypothetical protein
MLKCYEILGFMPQKLALDIFEESFAADKENYRVAFKAVADARKLRPVFFQQKPRAERHHDMLSTLSRPPLDTVASQFLCGWLLKTQPAMLSDFLDGLGIAHQQGVITECPPSVDDAKLAAVIETLLSKYPAERVAVYLNVFYATSDVHWPNLEQALASNARLQLV